MYACRKCKAHEGALQPIFSHEFSLFIAIRLNKFSRMEACVNESSDALVEAKRHNNWAMDFAQNEAQAPAAELADGARRQRSRG
jgi:hypothetical protein